MPLRLKPNYSEEDKAALYNYTKSFSGNGEEFGNTRYKMIAEKLNYANAFKLKEPKISVDNPYRSSIDKYSSKYGIDNNLMTKVLMKENNSLNTNAVSKAGAKGLMQFTDDTWKFVKDKLNEKGVIITSPFDSEDSLTAGAFYLSYLKEKFNSDELTLAAYNAGPGNVNKWIKQYGNNWQDINQGLTKDNSFLETRDYVSKIMGYEQ